LDKIIIKLAIMQPCFYPLISQFPTYRGLESAKPGKMPVAEKITEQVICLPIYPNLSFKNIGGQIF
jgi:dTDP-4-amino-4,6-dideoxygalactose transaminase